MHNDLFSIGPVTVHGYGLMIAVGILAAWLTAEYRGKRRGLNTDRIWGLIICAAVFGILGAKLLYYILEIPKIIRDPSILLDFSNGFVVYGGIIVGLFAGWVYCRHYQISFAQYIDIVLPSVALGQAFGRIGCFLAGCCYGRQVDCPISIVFTHSDFAPNGVPLLPSQLISSALDFLHFLILVRIAGRPHKDGSITLFYLLFYSIGRFLVEFVRGDLVRGSIGPLSTSQFISIWICLGACIGLYLLNKREQAEEA